MILLFAADLFFLIIFSFRKVPSEIAFEFLFLLSAGLLFAAIHTSFASIAFSTRLSGLVQKLSRLLFRSSDHLRIAASPELDAGTFSSHADFYVAVLKDSVCDETWFLLMMIGVMSALTLPQAIFYWILWAEKALLVSQCLRCRR